MSKKTIKDNLQRVESILESVNSGDSRKELALFIKQKNLQVINLLDIFNRETKARVRFTWLLGDIGEIAPELITSAVKELFSIYKETNITGFDRTMAKVFWQIGIPEPIEGEVIDLLFNWVMCPDKKVAVKVYSISALLNVCKKYPDLKQELRVVINDQLDKNSIAFKVRARDVLKELGSL